MNTNWSLSTWTDVIIDKKYTYTVWNKLRTYKGTRRSLIVALKLYLRYSIIKSNLLIIFPIIIEFDFQLQRQKRMTHFLNKTYEFYWEIRNSINYTTIGMILHVMSWLTFILPSTCMYLICIIQYLSIKLNMTKKPFTVYRKKSCFMLDNEISHFMINKH